MGVQWLRVHRCSWQKSMWNELWQLGVQWSPQQRLQDQCVWQEYSGRQYVWQPAAVRRQLVATSGEYGARDRIDCKPNQVAEVCVCSSRNCGVCESPVPTSNVRESSEVRNGSVWETSACKWGSNGRHSRVRKSGAAGTPVCVTAGECGVRDRSDCKLTPIHGWGFARAETSVFVTAAFASPLLLPVVFMSPAKFVTEACVRPVTANFEGPVGKVASVGYTSWCQRRERIWSSVDRDRVSSAVCIWDRRTTSRVFVTPILSSKQQRRPGQSSVGRAAWRAELIKTSVGRYPCWTIEWWRCSKMQARRFT